MITKEQLQRFIDKNVQRIAEVCPGGLKDARGKWILVCPVMERFDLDLSKIGTPTSTNDEREVVEKPKKSTKSKGKGKKK